MTLRILRELAILLNMRTLIFGIWLLFSALASALPLPKDCYQLVMVVTPDWSQPHGQLRRFQRTSENGPWKEVGSPWLVVVGRNGLAWGDAPENSKAPVKKEGDGRAPAGLFAITDLWLRLGIAPPGRLGFRPHRIEADTVGVDDPRSSHYNRIVRQSETRVDWTSCEKMDIPDYDRVLVVAHNTATPQPGRGSCIFIHRWESAEIATSGCTAMAEGHMELLVGWLRPDARPFLVQLPRAEAQAWQVSGELPR